MSGVLQLERVRQRVVELEDHLESGVFTIEGVVAESALNDWLSSVDLAAILIVLDRRTRLSEL